MHERIAPPTRLPPTHELSWIAAGIFSSGPVQRALWSRDLHRLRKGNADVINKSICESDVRTGVKVGRFIQPLV